MQLKPDINKVNPVFKNAATMKLYAPDQIHTIEQSIAFLNALEKAKERKLAASKAVQTKKKRLIDIIDSVQIHIEEDANLLNHASPIITATGHKQQTEYVHKHQNGQILYF